MLPEGLTKNARTAFVPERSSVTFAVTVTDWATAVTFTIAGEKASEISCGGAVSEIGSDDGVVADTTFEYPEVPPEPKACTR